MRRPDRYPAAHPARNANRGIPSPGARILLADDNAAILEHVASLLENRYEIIGKLRDGSLVCAEVERTRPDLIVLDISMGESSGIEIAQQLRGQGYRGEIVFLTVHEDTDFVTAAISAGGRGYVIKSRMNRDLIPAINAALSHHIFISGPFLGK